MTIRNVTLLFFSFSSLVQSSFQGNQAYLQARFSLYPNVAKEDPPSMKQAVKVAVAGLGDLGVSIVRADDVSSCLIGVDSTIWEALRSCFSRSSISIDGRTPRGISLQATLHTLISQDDKCPLLLPPRRVQPNKDDEWVMDAFLQPNRIAAQFSIYPLGIPSYMDVFELVQDCAKCSSCWKESLGQTTIMLDGNGNEVWDTLRKCMMVAQKTTDTIAMSVTLTANKNAWTVVDRKRVSQR
jgi:YKOF-related Family